MSEGVYEAKLSDQDGAESFRLLNIEISNLHLKEGNKQPLKLIISDQDGKPSLLSKENQEGTLQISALPDTEGRGCFLLSNADDKGQLGQDLVVFSDGKILPVSNFVGRSRDEVWNSCITEYAKSRQDVPDPSDESKIISVPVKNTISRKHFVVVEDPKIQQHILLMFGFPIFQITRADGGFRVSNNPKFNHAKWFLDKDIFISNSGEVREFNQNNDRIKIGKTELITHLNKHYSDKPLIHELISRGLVTIQNKGDFKTLTIKITPYFKFTDKDGKLLEEFEGAYRFSIKKDEYLKVEYLEVDVPNDNPFILIGNGNGATLLSDVLRLDLETAQLSKERDNNYHFFPEQVYTFYRVLKKTCIAKIQENLIGKKVATEISNQDLPFSIQNTCFKYTGNNPNVLRSQNPVYKADLKELSELGASVYIPKISPNGYVDYVKFDPQDILTSKITILPPGTKIVINNEEYLVIGEKFPRDPFFEINNLFKKIFDLLGAEYKFNPKEILNILTDLEGVTSQTDLMLAVTNDLGNSKLADIDEVSEKGTGMADYLTDELHKLYDAVKGIFGGDGCTVSGVVKLEQIPEFIQTLAQKDLQTTDNTEFNIRTGVVAFNYNKFIDYLMEKAGIGALETGKIKEIISLLKKIAEIFSDYLQTTGKESTIKGNTFTINTQLAKILPFKDLDQHSFSGKGVSPEIKQHVQVVENQESSQTAIFTRYQEEVTTFSSYQIANNIISYKVRLNALKNT
jgi:hypothetical protein